MVEVMAGSGVLAISAGGVNKGMSILISPVCSYSSVNG